MNLIFMGTPDFAVPTLKKLCASDHEVSLVVTGPDKPRGRGQKVKPTPVKQVAQEFGLPVYQPHSLKRPEVAQTLKEYPAELYVVVAFRILPETIIEIPTRGVINLHASLLPRYRGAAPIQWALLNGEQETGVTTFFIEKGIDTGDIIYQKAIPILPEDNAGSLHDKLAVIGADLVLETVNAIEEGRAPRIKQVGAATPAPKITKEMCQIDWQASRQKIVNQVRAFSPFPGAYTGLRGKLVKIYSCNPVDWNEDAQPGQLMIVRNRIFVKAADGWLEVKELQLAGKRRLHAEEFLRGFEIESGEMFVNSNPLR